MDFQFLIELGAVLGFTGFALSKAFDFLKTRANANSRIQANKAGSPNMISSLVSNIDSIIDQQHKLRQKQIEAGASPEALKPLDEQIKRLEWVRANQSWLQFVSPYADQIAAGAMKLMTRVMR